MPPPQQQQQNSNPGPYVFAMAVAFLVAGWIFVHDPMARVLLSAISLVNLPFSVLPSGTEVDAWLSEAFLRVGDVTFGMVLRVASEAGKPYRWLVVPLAGYVIYSAMRSPVLRLRHEHTQQSLLEFHSRTWKAIVPFLKRDLTQNNKGPFAPGMSAPEFARKYRLVSDKQLDLTRARDVLERELGAKWAGPDKMRDYEKAMFAVFALRILRKKDAALELLNALNESARKSGKVNPKVALEAFESVKSDKKVLKAIKPHGYARTVLFAMLAKAREFDGILQPAMFLWLKEFDRTLFYALHRVPVGGRMSFTAWIEGVAVANQWQAEVVAADLGRRLTKPYVDGAISALREDLYDTGVIN